MAIDGWVPVFEARDATCAGLLRLKLEAAGIEVHVDQEDLARYIPVMGVPGFASPRLMVREEDVAEARRILAELPPGPGDDPEAWEQALAEEAEAAGREETEGDDGAVI